MNGPLARRIAARKANAYDPQIHGVCGWPRPTETGRCACGLAVEQDADGEWTHYVAPWRERLQAKELTHVG
jgi:hypothetical protein